MTKESFEGWQSYTVTNEVKALLEKRLKNKVELLQELATGCQSKDTMVLQSARLGGIILGINEFLELTWDDFVQEGVIEHD